ncbi:hypothetical protein DFH08DRAFT_695495 [Mycena albidolilacea]|uniref:Uncharacterized protein n=1 Tax=Mycena albidolilacea TaxID=1033008 RepID=A0AAD7A6V4_9AGAR|nr:hypothetical protein DFH08DRAFT_695495 [Mycena albidolilacea]
MPLPSDFTSLYRLFLRTSSASVLHQSKSTKTLRKLWRPTFEDAARATNRLQSNSLSAVRRNEVEIWLRTWHLRIDNTLALLYTSCKTRGLSHRLTRNLGVLVQHEQLRINSMKLPKWRPSLPADAAEYQTSYEDKQFTATKQRQEEAAPAWNALEEVVRMAEGRSELSLGRIALKRTL